MGLVQNDGNEQEIEQNRYSSYFTGSYLYQARLNLKQMPHLSINVNKL
jgi:hypothetical protein